MDFSLVDVASANFKTDLKSDNLNTVFMERLGMRQRYQPARLAISCSLSSDAQLKALSSDEKSGKIIRGETLFGTGTELSVWIAMIVQYRIEGDMDIKRLNSLVGAHWKRGLSILDEKWKDAGEDIPQFVRDLVATAELPRRSNRVKK